LRRIRDFLFLVATALITCAIMVGTFIFTEIHHHNPLWTFVTMVSIVLLVLIRQKYRQEFQLPRFVFFVLVCLAINIVVIVVVLTSFGWLYLFPVFFLEQVLFYMLIDRLFGISRSKSPRQS
jgi:hypothetical protein